MRNRRTNCRRTGCLLLSALSIQLLSPLPFTEAAQTEQRFPTKDDPKVVISDASTVVIRSWARLEVSVSAEVIGEAIQANEVTIKAEKNKVDVSCHPSKPDRKIRLTVTAPPRAVVRVDANGNSVEVKGPAGETTVAHVSKDLILLSAPPAAALDMSRAPRGFARRQLSPGGIATTGVGGRTIGTGPPFVKVTANAQVDITLGSIELPKKPITNAAQTIVRRGGLMGQALARSNPRLIRPQREQASPLNPADRDEAVLRLETHLVNLNVSATDSVGKAVPGLTQEDFSIYEDGVQQRISFFSPEQSPFNLVLLLDLSGSMRDEIELIKETAKHFLDVIGTQDSVAVVTFTTDVTVVSLLTKDRDDLRESIDYMLAPAGGTAFYDALGFALVEVLRKSRGQRNAIITISDGEDNAIQADLVKRPGIFSSGVSSGSFLTFDELLMGAAESDALIYPVHLNPAPAQVVVRSGASGNSSAQLRSDPVARMSEIQEATTEIATKQLHSLADASGARFFHANRIEDLKGVFEQVAAELRTVYSMAYTPTNLSFDGRFRRIQVKANKTGVVIRTRPGYYAR